LCTSFHRCLWVLFYVIKEKVVSVFVRSLRHFTGVRGLHVTTFAKLLSW
jgi:hypothetical protein